MFLERFSKLELCILQHNVSLDSYPQLRNTPPPPVGRRAPRKKVNWRPWKYGETE